MNVWVRCSLFSILVILVFYVAQEKDVNAQMEPINYPPVLDPIGDKVIYEGDTLEFTITGTDPEGDTLTFSASNLPTGATFNPNTQQFVWTPDFTQSGVYPNVLFTVTDNGMPPESDSESITITVGNVIPGAQCPEPFLINTTIDSTYFEYDGCDIIVGDGVVPVTVTIDGTHTFASLTIKNNATVTHSETDANTIYSLDLNISGNVIVEPGGAINTYGRGFLGAFREGNPTDTGRTTGNVTTNGSSGNAGGSHGGQGGYSSGVAGIIYGDLANPVEPGAGGGSGSGAGADGGGLIRLIVSGTLTNNGTISADGVGRVNNPAGGGAGGGIYIEAVTVSGSGIISANGGRAGTFGANGGGGGGRIALITITNNFTGILSVAGGEGSGGIGIGGVAGTIYQQQEPTTPEPTPEPITVVNVYNGPDSGLLRGLSWDGARLWSCTSPNGFNSTIYMHNMDSSLSVGAIFPSPSTYTVGIEWINGRLWSGDNFTDSLVKHRAITSIDATFGLNGRLDPESITWDGVNIWVTNEGANLQKFDADGTFIEEFTIPGTGDISVAYMQDELILIGSANKIYQLDMSNNFAILETFDGPGTTISGLAWDGYNLWIADNVENKIYKTTFISDQVVVDTKINGEDGPLFLTTDDIADFTFMVDAGNTNFQDDFDWWIGALTPSGTYWATPSRNFVKSDTPISIGQYLLTNQPVESLVNETLPVGYYTFFIILDNNPNGVLDDMSWDDSVTVGVSAGSSDVIMSNEHRTIFSN